MSIIKMEMDECSANGDSGAEEDEDDEMSQGSGSNTSTTNSSDSSSSSESGEDSDDDQGTSVSEANSSLEDEDDENNDDSHKEEGEGSEDLLRWETCIAAGIKVKLPQDLCEHASIFRELFNYPRLWQETLSDSQKDILYNFLPQFPKDCDAETELENTLKMLFDGENDRFGVSPLDLFHKNLSTGYFRPDIRRIRSLVRKAQHRRALFAERKHAYELANQLLKSRENLLLNAYKQGFSQTSHRTLSKFHWRKPKPALVEEKAQLRYMEEMNSLRTELGASANLVDDSTSENEENYPQFQLSNSKQKKRKRPVMTPQIPLIRGMQLNNEDDAIRPVFSTVQRSEYIPRLSLREQTEDSYRSMLVTHKKRRTRRDNHPELNTQGISLPDLMQRAQIGQKHKLTSPGPIRLPTSKKRIKLDQHPSLQPLPKIASNVIKIESDSNDYTHATEEIKHSNFSEIEHKNPNFPIVKTEPVENYEPRPPPKQKLMPMTPKSSKNHPIMIPISEVKREVEDLDYETGIKIEQSANDGIRMDTEEDEVDKKELDLDSIDMMQLPIQLDDGIDILNEVKCENEEMMIPEKEVSVTGGDDLSLPDGGDIELMQETHACFFSLLRDAFLSKGEYRMNTTEMKEAVMLWQGNPISPLNDWYSMAPSWTSLVPLALGFLAGELTYPQDSEQNDGEQELVPYLENKGRGIYAWIGAGRDSDLRLSTLCARFLLHRDELGPPQAMLQATNSTKNQMLQTNIATTNSICPIPSSNRPESPVSESVGTEASLVSSVAEWEPPRALYPTDWKVRPSSFEEREEFRRQERMRYAAPHKAFTYRMHGYSSVVGPVKGIYQHNVGSGLTKPRGHSLLVADRPNFVTILALVRDATARLPNGEGTRADICQLLKDSQYIREIDESDSSHDKEGNLHSVVSGALDRLHYENDPCVRYYPRRKEWLYLHRARSESEFEMFHQQFQGVPKNKKSSSGSSRNKSLQSNSKLAGNKDQAHSQSSNVNKETTPKKEKKSTQSAPVITRKETRKAEEKIVLEQPTSIEPPTIISSNPSQITTTQSVSVVTPSSTTPTSSIPSNPSSSLIIPRETSLPVETRTQLTPPIKKVPPSPSVKNVAVVKTNSSQSLLQSNQQHFPPHQIQVSTSAGLQTIRLSGHSVLHSAQPVSTTMASNSGSTSPSIATIFPNAKVQNQQQQTVIANQGAKSILQTANVKQQQHVLPGKTLLSSQIKLVSSGQIKSLLSGHGLQGQTIFIKQSSLGSGQTQQIQQQQQQQQLKQQQQQQQQQQLQQRIVTANQQQLQNPPVQRIITQIGGKPIAVQIQQSPQQQQQQQQKILAKVLTSAGGGQLISVESLLAQKGLKLATPTGHTTQINRQGKQVIQTQYQVVSQAQTSSVPPKIIVSSHQQQQQQTQNQAQTVRMVTAQLAGKPIVLASGSKGVGVGGGTGVILGKQSPQAQSSQQQPIILPSQLLNIKTLHGLKVIPTAAGLKTTGAAVYARVIAPTTISSTQTTTNQQQTVQTQAPRTNSYTP